MWILPMAFILRHFPSFGAEWSINGPTQCSYECGWQQSRPDECSPAQTQQRCRLLFSVLLPSEPSAQHIRAQSALLSTGLLPAFICTSATWVWIMSPTLLCSNLEGNHFHMQMKSLSLKKQKNKRRTRMFFFIFSPHLKWQNLWLLPASNTVPF